jgi:hypothetical protein
VRPGRTGRNALLDVTSIVFAAERHCQPRPGLPALVRRLQLVEGESVEIRARYRDISQFLTASKQPSTVTHYHARVLPLYRLSPHTLAILRTNGPCFRAVGRPLIRTMFRRSGSAGATPSGLGVMGSDHGKRLKRQASSAAKVSKKGLGRRFLPPQIACKALPVPGTAWTSRRSRDRFSGTPSGCRTFLASAGPEVCARTPTPVIFWHPSVIGVPPPSATGWSCAQPPEDDPHVPQPTAGQCLAPLCPQRGVPREERGPQRRPLPDAGVGRTAFRRDIAPGQDAKTRRFPVPPVPRRRTNTQIKSGHRGARDPNGGIRARLYESFHTAIRPGILEEHRDR